MNWIQNRINQLESQLGNPEVLDQKRVETKLEAYREILSAARCGALDLADVSFSLDDLKSFFNKGYKAGMAEALSKPQDILPSYEQHIDYEVGKIIHKKKSNES